MTGRVVVDRLVVGAGAFGLYAAHVLLSRGLTVAIVDTDTGTLTRASLVNQARLHNGYHYPRSAWTALQAARNYERFVADFPAAINRRFTMLYAVAATGSLTDATHFERFCRAVGIPARLVDPSPHFRPGSVEAVFETEECSFDVAALRTALVQRLGSTGVSWLLGRTVLSGRRNVDGWQVGLDDQTEVHATGVVNASYAGTNAVLGAFGLAPLLLKYELCEVALVEAPGHVGVGITVVDGDFFSLMPFGHTGLHSLTAVAYTPRRSAKALLPDFACQSLNPACTPEALDNCGTCRARPASAFPHMRALASQFIDQAGLEMVASLNSMKVLLRTTEIDDARPTLVRRDSDDPLFTTVFSGKINTIFDLQETRL